APQGQPEIVLRQRELRLEPQGFSVLLDCRGLPSLQEVHVAKVVVGEGQPGVDSQCPLKLPLRLVEASLLHEAHSELVVSGRKGREELDRPPEMEIRSGLL